MLETTCKRPSEALMAYINPPITHSESRPHHHRKHHQNNQNNPPQKSAKMQPTYPQIPTSTSAGPADIDNPAKNSQFTPTIHRTLYPSVSPTNPNLTQSSQVVIVTGASQGIGRTIALSFAHANAAAIVLVARNTKNLALTAARIHAENKSTKVLTVAADISSQADVSRLEATVRAEFGRADVLVNAAGVWGGRGVISKTPSELWWRDSVCYPSPLD